MDLFWPDSFEAQLDRLEAESDSGDEQAKAVFEYVVAEMEHLRRLKAPPVDDTPTLKRVRQSRQYPLWRVSHPYHEGIAVRLICWFPPDDQKAVVALFSGQKATMGDVFYDSVGTRADQIIDQWLREGAQDDDEDSEEEDGVQEGERSA